MFILDTSNARVLRWPLSEPIGDIVVGGRGIGSGFHQIGTSQGMFVDAQQNIYVSEQSNHRVTLWYNGNTTAGVLVTNCFMIFSCEFHLICRWPVGMVLETHLIN